MGPQGDLGAIQQSYSKRVPSAFNEKGHQHAYVRREEPSACNEKGHQHAYVRREEPSACNEKGHQHAYVRREEPLEAWLHEQRPAMRAKVDLEQRTPKSVVHHELYPIDPGLEVESLDGDRDGRAALRFGRGVRQVRRHCVVAVEALASVSGRAQGATEDAAAPDCRLRVPVGTGRRGERLHARQVQRKTRPRRTAVSAYTSGPFR
jgi:hypothetical protein